MNRLDQLVIILLAGILGLSAQGCRTSYGHVIEGPIEPLSGSEKVDIPGPSTIRPDGSTRNLHLDRPNGQLLKTSTAKALRQHQVDPWARNQALVVAANNGLSPEEVQGWIRITGPRRMMIDEDTTADVYDVTLEIWKRAEEPRQRQRMVE